jgi:hypothetical protein
MAAPLQELDLLSQYLRDISEEDLVRNFEQMATQGGRKMSFSIKGPSVDKLTIRFTPEFLNEWQPKAKSINKTDVKKRANNDLTLAFRAGNALVEVVYKDSSRTAYASEKIAKKLNDKTLVLQQNGKDKSYKEIKVINEEGFETMLRSLVHHIQAPDEMTQQLSKEELLLAAQDLPPSQAAEEIASPRDVKRSASKARPAPSLRSKTPPEVEESALAKQEEKTLEKERDKKHEEETDKQQQARVDKTINAQIKEEEVRGDEEKLYPS